MVETAVGDDGAPAAGDGAGPGDAVEEGTCGSLGVFPWMNREARTGIHDREPPLNPERNPGIPFTIPYFL